MADQPGIIRFGIFEVTLGAGELRKNGSRVKLQEQPFQVLAALLERPGEVVTKEELKDRLWAGDTFVDFDHSLSTAVNKIREALGDSASSPRFVETVPRRGYRFVSGTTSAPGTPEPEDSGAGRTFPSRRKIAWVGAAVALLALVLWGVSRRGSETTPTAAPQEPRPLTSLPGREENPALSPDGTRVAYSWSGETGENADIYVQVVGSSNHLRLTTDPARDLWPAWSPDGRQIAFVRHSGSRRTIYLTSPVGGQETKVADIPQLARLFASAIAWGPEGQSILYSAPESPGKPAAIWRLFFDTGEKQRLSFPAEDLSQGDDRLPIVSPDGRTLAFTRGTTSSASSEIWLMPLEGGEARKLTSHGQGIMGHAWTPDSREIVYSRGGSGHSGRLWRVSIETGESRLLSSYTGDSWLPTISAQGRRLAYQSYDGGANIWLYPLPQEENSESPRPVASSTYGDGDAQISPDGNRIAFNSSRSGAPEIWTCDREGKNLLQLTSLGVRAGSPRWSPDGRRIAFDSIDQGDWEIYIVDAEGGAPRRLTRHEGVDARPSWSRDGQWVYFTSDRLGSIRTWKVPGDGGEAAPVTEGPNDWQPFESPDGRFLYFSRQLQDSELWRRPVEGGDEVFTGLVLPLTEGAFAWDVAEDGIYFIELRETTDSTGKWFLRLLRYGASEPVDVMEVPPPTAATPLDVSPDGKWFVYTQGEQVGSDLMVVDNFE